MRGTASGWFDRLRIGAKIVKVQKKALTEMGSKKEIKQFPGILRAQVPRFLPNVRIRLDLPRHRKAAPGDSGPDGRAAAEALPCIATPDRKPSSDDYTRGAAGTLLGRPGGVRPERQQGDREHPEGVWRVGNEFAVHRDEMGQRIPLRWAVHREDIGGPNRKHRGGVSRDRD